MAGIRPQLVHLAVALSCVPVPLATAWAQPAGSAEAAARRTDLQLLNDFIHYVRVARYDLAADLASELLDRGVTDEAFVALVESDPEALRRFDETLALATRVPALEDLAGRLSTKFDAGKLARARNLAEIDAAIELLVGDLRQREIGRLRLLNAGEYAMPRLLDAMFDQNIRLRSEVERVLIDLGRQAIIPLGTALPKLPPSRQARVVTVLGQIQYRTSVPFILDVLRSADNPEVREACTLALERLGASVNDDPASLYQELAESYYEHRIEVTSFPGEAYQLVWSYDEAASALFPTAVLTEVFHEAMCMRLARRSLDLRPESSETVALWVAANLRREVDSPAGYANPEYSAENPDARFFAVAAGSNVTMRVLRRAIDATDVRLALRAIDALNATTGVNVLTWADESGRRPMLEALQFRNRRVQYEASLAIGASQPRAGFAGAERVVPLLASAIRDAGDKFAAVVAGTDREEYARVRAYLESRGYQVIPPADTIAELAPSAAGVPGIDLVVTSVAIDATRNAITELRSTPQFAAAPILSLLDRDEELRLEAEFIGDETVDIARRSLDDAGLNASIEALVLAAAGGDLTEADALVFAQRSLAVLRDLAVSGNAVLPVAEAALPLMAALPEAPEANQVRIADVLAHIDQQRTQAAVAEAALDSAGPLQVQLLAQLANSGKRFGNRLDDRMVGRLIELAGSNDLPARTAAAAAMGSLGVPYTGLLDLIDSTSAVSQ